jgi:3'(2'), 5'-bisphosphate nucleotidase
LDRRGPTVDEASFESMSGATGRELQVERTAAVHAAVAAGRFLRALRARLADPDVDVASLRREADAGANALICRELRHAFPDDPILSEESADEPGRHDSRRVWIVDPLDGTREFAELGRTDWAVHIALAIDGDPKVGVVALPGQDRVVLDGPRAGPRPHALCPRIVVSRTRPPREAEWVRDELGGALHPLGSAGAKTIAVVDGAADLYIHGGGQYEWDSAAPVAVARAAGLHASRLDGSPLVYNQASPDLPDLLICRVEYAERALAALRAAPAPSS